MLTYYVHGGGGGGGPFGPKDFLLVLTGLCTMYGCAFYVLDNPRFNMRMDRGYLGHKNEINVDVKCTNKSPKIMSIEHTGLDCMKAKGYTITNPYGSSFLNVRVTHGGGIDSIDNCGFFRDCKECDVSTDFTYMDTNNITDEHRYGNRSYKWHKCSLPELK